jgi:hypothetical protein
VLVVQCLRGMREVVVVVVVVGGGGGGATPADALDAAPRVVDDVNAEHGARGDAACTGGPPCPPSTAPAVGTSPRVAPPAHRRVQAVHAARWGWSAAARWWSTSQSVIQLAGGPCC